MMTAAGEAYHAFSSVLRQVLVLAREIDHLRDFGFGDFAEKSRKRPRPSGGHGA
ncbi:MAG: hypothetical protein IPN48_04965 [Sphingomonadales bacterium]|nr:hypothetical protein [Sphingomonadales bacterium]